MLRALRVGFRVMVRVEVRFRVKVNASACGWVVTSAVLVLRLYLFEAGVYPFEVFIMYFRFFTA